MVFGTVAAAIALGIGLFVTGRIFVHRGAPAEISSQARMTLPLYRPSASEWASLSVAPVSDRVFRAEHITMIGQGVLLDAVTAHMSVLAN